jgi:hypothetical protein
VKAGKNRRHHSDHPFAALVHSGILQSSPCFRHWKTATLALTHLNYEILKTVSQILTYIGLSASSILTWINLHFKTAQDPDFGHRKTLTPAGQAARIFLVVSFILTIVSAIVQNYADSKLKGAAERRGTAAIQAALESQHNLYVEDLKQQFEGPNGVIPKMGAQAKALKAAESLIVTQSTETVSQLTGSESYAVLMYVPGQGDLAFIHTGKYPLYGVSARIVDFDQIKTNLGGKTVPVGDMIRGHANAESIPAGIPTTGDHFNANIFFTARNGDWIEMLRVVRVNDGWSRAVRVMGLFTSLRKEKTMCETIDTNFPRNANHLLDEFKPINGPKPPRCW